MIQIIIDNYWVSKLSYFSALNFAETLLSHDEIAFLVIFSEQNMLFQADFLKKIECSALLSSSQQCSAVLQICIF